MSESPYAEALSDRWSPVDAALHQAYEQPAAANLPAVRDVQQSAVVTPTVLPAAEQRRGVDLVSLRIAATGVGAAGIGLGVDLAGQGIAKAGPYLWALAGCLLALAGLVALIKGHAAPASGGTTVTISGGKNRIGSIG